MTLSEIQTAIASGNFSTTELNNLMQFVRGVQTRQTKQSIRVGDNVVVVQKTKRTPGVVVDIKVKNAIVDMRGLRYRVPMSMLESA
jgi:hypothetical protein